MDGGRGGRRGREVLRETQAEVAVEEGCGKQAGSAVESRGYGKESGLDRQPERRMSDTNCFYCLLSQSQLFQRLICSLTTVCGSSKVSQRVYDCLSYRHLNQEDGKNGPWQRTPPLAQAQNAGLRLQRAGPEMRGSPLEIRGHTGSWSCALTLPVPGEREG